LEAAPWRGPCQQPLSGMLYLISQGKKPVDCADILTAGIQL
jgi:hypothetical protein